MVIDIHIVCNIKSAVYNHKLKVKQTIYDMVIADWAFDYI